MLDEDVSPEPEEDNSHTSFPLPLPHLSTTPLNHPDCCLSLSTTLIHRIVDILRPDAHSPPSTTLSVLSIGSGTGLLEAILATHAPTGALEVHGVEVFSSSSANKYIPTHLRHIVPSTSAMYEDATDFPVWIFIYPRDPRLVRQYLDLAVKNEQARQVTFLFLGPKADFLPPASGEGDDGDGEAQQDTFADVLGSFSDHIERCHDFVEQDESTSLKHSSDNGSTFDKPFRASVFSSTDAGLPSYEVLCVLGTSDPKKTA
ncbi:hypothetical protein PV11_00760 [Exophiala sideris]|uniref:Uncharacterized protein n=1 Tax=Exophiala sideris TaxID=1016849 RepID=A0A0D1YQM3_9EURO|nr:hypothetical protein PV11_00760 [Exophiala sideris]